MNQFHDVSRLYMYIAGQALHVHEQLVIECDDIRAPCLMLVV